MRTQAEAMTVLIIANLLLNLLQREKKGRKRGQRRWSPGFQRELSVSVVLSELAKAYGHKASRSASQTWVTSSGTFYVNPRNGVEQNTWNLSINIPFFATQYFTGSITIRFGAEFPFIFLRRPRTCSTLFRPQSTKKVHEGWIWQHGIVFWSVLSTTNV